MTLKLVANNPEPTLEDMQGAEWLCTGCGCTILKGSMAGVRVRKGELNLAADSCYTGKQMKCEGCDQVAAVLTKGRWKILN